MQQQLVGLILESGVKMNKNKILCACNGLECSGVCRSIHLHQARDWTEPKDYCPETYEVDEYGKEIRHAQKKIQKTKRANKARSS